MKKLLAMSLVLGLATIAWPVQADQGTAQKNPTKSSANQSNEHATKQAYLGVGVESLPPALSSHLRGTLPKGQGVLVGDVAPNSPAAKAGLQTNDILVSFDDQKVYSPEQLIKLVHDTTPGHEATVGYVREGKSETCKVTLGERPAMTAHEEQQQNMQRPPSADQFREFFEQFQRKNDNSALEMMDSMKLTRLDNNRWRAEIDYRTKDGKKEHKSFEGTRDDLRQDIQTAKDLPTNEKNQLLHSLNMDGMMFEQGFPFMHFGGMGPMSWNDR